jgi:hypothetical protein
VAEYTYLLSDLRTNAVLATLPLTQVSYDKRLNGVGTFSGSLPLGDARVAELDPFGSTQPGRTALFVDRDGVLDWGGILWTRRYDSASSALELQAQDFWSYLSHRIVIPRGSEPIPGQVTYDATWDEVAIARDLVGRMQELSGGDIGLQLAGSTSSGVTTNGYAFADNDHKPYAEAIQTIAQAQAGFDFGSDAIYDSAGNPQKFLTFSYPRRGATVASTGLVFELPGQILNYRWPEDATAMANSILVYGTGYGGTMATGSAADTAMVAAGYPLLEVSPSDKDVGDDATLAIFAQAYLAAYRQPVVLPELDVDPGQDPVLGAYTVGDECRVRILDRRFPEGIDEYFRIVQIKVTPQETQHELVTLTMGLVFGG